MVNPQANYYEFDTCPLCGAKRPDIEWLDDFTREEGEKIVRFERYNCMKCGTAWWQEYEPKMKRICDIEKYYADKTFSEEE